MKTDRPKLETIKQDKFGSFLSFDTRRIVNENAEKLAGIGFAQRPSRPTLFSVRAEKWSIFADLDSTEEKRIWEVDCIPALYAFPAFSEDPEPPSCRKCVVEIADAILKENGIEVSRGGQKQEETVRRVLCNRIFQRWIPAQMRMAGFGETAGMVRNARGLESALKKTLEARDTIAGGRNPDTGEYLENKSDPVVMTLLAGLEQLEDNERRMDLGETAAEVAEDTLLVIVHGGQPEEDFDLVQEYLETIREACGRPE